MIRYDKNKLFSGIVIALILFLTLFQINVGFAAFMSIGSLCITLGIFYMPSGGYAGDNYVPSALLKAQTRLIKKYTDPEKREVDPVTFMQFRKQSEILIPSHNMLRTREDRALEAYMMLRTKRALGNARTHAPAGGRGDTTPFNPSFVTKSDGFSISMKQADNNVFMFEEMFANEVENVFKNFAYGEEVLATNYLFNNRSGVNVAVSEGTFNPVTDAFEIQDSLNGHRAMQITTSAMNENLYGAMPMTVFCDTISFNKFDFLSKQGQSNATNTSFQFANKTFVNSLYLTALAATQNYTKGFWMVVPDGTIGVMDWIPKQNREGVIKAPYKYSTFANPLDGINYALFNTYAAQDSTAIGGYTQDILDQFEFSVDLAFEKAPLSTAGETTIQAFALI